MKKLIIIFICGLTTTINAQEVLPAPIIKKISDHIAEKIVGKYTPKRLPINLTSEQIKTLSNYYPTVISNTGKEEHLVFVDGALYRTDLTVEELTIRLKREEQQSDPNIQAQIDAIDRIGASTPSSASTGMNKNYIKDLQKLLFYLGYDITCDGIWGPKTKQGIQDIFGIDCTNLSAWEAALRVYAMHRPKPSKQIFNLQIKNPTTGEKIKEKVNVSETILNEELKEFTCEPEQLCIGLSKLSGGLKFKCTGSNGDVDIEISTREKLSVDMNFYAPGGGSTKISFDSNGKMKFTNTSNGNIKGVTN